MSKKIVDYLYIDMSGVYSKKTPRLDLTDIPGTNCYCDDPAKAQIEERLKRLSHIPLVRFIDSGNYHYMSLFFMRQIDEPFVLLLLDNHPDTKEAAFGHITSCGGWVREACESINNLKQVIIAGANQTLVNEASPLPRKALPSDIDSAPGLIINGLPVYISLDKDVMTDDYARTDWSQGTASLNDIENVIRQTAASRRIIGIDICGEKKEDPTESDLLINDRTNEVLISLFDTIKL